MRIRKFILLMSIALFLFPCLAVEGAEEKAEAPAPAPVEPADMDDQQFAEGLVPACERLAAQEQANGWWKAPAGADDGLGGDGGHTALATSALQKAMRCLILLPRDEYPDIRSKLDPAVKRGRKLILQTRPEARIVPAYLVGQVFHGWGVPARLNTYAWIVIAAQAAGGQESWSFPSEGRGRGSSMFFATLAMRTAEQDGFQIPRLFWERARTGLLATQHADGGWGADESSRKGASTPVETFEGAAALYAVEDALTPRAEWAAQKDSPELDRALARAETLMKGGYSPYGWYVLMQLASVTKRLDFGGIDPRRLCVNELLPQLKAGRPEAWPDLAFALLAVTQDRVSVSINKLRRAGDWQTSRGDVRHFTEEQDRWGNLCRSWDWRTVTLEADLATLLKTPILFINGRGALKFDDAEKKRLKAYVDGGGTILAEAVDASPAFDASFRALLGELWPDRKLEALPSGHRVFESPRPIAGPKPQVLALNLAAAHQNADRMGVFYFAKGGLGVRWAQFVRGTRSLDVAAAAELGVNIWCYAKFRRPETRPPGSSLP